MLELKPSLFPYLYLRRLLVLGGTREGDGPDAHSEELLFVTNAISRVLLVSSFILFVK
jgi:hypothetical protein